MAEGRTISIIILALVSIIAVIGIMIIFKGGASPGRAINIAPITTTSAPLSASQVYTAPQQPLGGDTIAPKTVACKTFGPIGAVCHVGLGVCCKQTLGTTQVVCSSQSGAGRCRVV